MPIRYFQSYENHLGLFSLKQSTIPNFVDSFKKINKKNYITNNVVLVYRYMVWFLAIV